MAHADGDFDIYMMDLAKKKLVQLTNASDQDGTPVWSSDADKTLFRSHRSNTNENN